MTYNRNYLDNGKFLDDVDHWTVSGASYLASDGSDHFGIAVLEAAGNEYIEQEFVVPRTRLYTLHIAVKELVTALAAGDLDIEIYDSDSVLVTTLQPTANAATWTDYSTTVGLVAGENYKIKIINADATAHTNDIYVDDIWLWDVAISRSSVAAIVHDRLGALATDKSLSTAASGSLTEGDYTYAIDSALRRLGAIEPEGAVPDVRYLDISEVEDLIGLVITVMLEQLQIEYSSEVDISVGPRRESLSQISKAIGGLLGGSGGGAMGTVVERGLKHE